MKPGYSVFTAFSDGRMTGGGNVSVLRLMIHSVGGIDILISKVSGNFQILDVKVT